VDIHKNIMLGIKALIICICLKILETRLVVTEFQRIFNNILIIGTGWAVDVFCEYREDIRRKSDELKFLRRSIVDLQDEIQTLTKKTFSLVKSVGTRRKFGKRMLAKSNEPLESPD
jgi:hypothetical protein